MLTLGCPEVYKADSHFVEAGVPDALMHCRARRLPGYAPDLNPTELVWGNVKGRELANLCADNLGEVERAVRTGLRRVRRAPTLAFAFLRHAGLSC